jgi:predicted nucleotidyltransferase
MLHVGQFELDEAGIAELCRRYKVKRLELFGSAARDEMRPDSDISGRI